jgi:putative hydrolase of the HAD superfamily
MPLPSVSADRPDGYAAINAVIFDYGLVLVSSPTAEEFGRMAAMFNLSVESFYELWEASRGPYDRGDFSAEEYWLKLAAQTSTTLDPKKIEILREIEVEIWVHPIPGMLDWLGQLHAAGIKTGLLSNMPWDLANYVRANFQWLEKFSFKTLSAEVGMIKPDAAIYEHTLRGLGVPAAEALFIDDREPNIRAARALGMRAIQFRSIEQLKRELEAMGFPVLPATSSAEVSGRGDNQEKFSALL